MIKVCHMTSAHTGKDTRIFYKECTSLAKNGYDVYLVVRGESREENGVHVQGVGQPTGGRVSRMIGFSRKVFRLAKTIDAQIYHIHDPELLPYGLKLKREGKIVVYDAHENYTEQIKNKKYIPKLFRTVLAKCFWCYETYVSKRIDAVVFPCSINGKNIFNERCKNVIYVDNFPILSENVVRDERKAGNGFSICCTGTLAPERGITQLIKAAYAAGVRLILAGKYQSEPYQKAVEAMQEYACVDYRGYINDRKELYAIYNESSIGMSTILNIGQYYSGDNLPTKIYEYMIAGLPVILSDSQFAMRFITQHKIGLCVDTSDYRSIASAIVYIKGHPQEAKQMGAAGYKAVVEEFNWSTQEDKLLQLYKELIKENENG